MYLNSITPSFFWISYPPLCIFFVIVYLVYYYSYSSHTPWLLNKLTEAKGHVYCPMDHWENLKFKISLNCTEPWILPCIDAYSIYENNSEELIISLKKEMFLHCLPGLFNRQPPTNPQPHSDPEWEVGDLEHRLLESHCRNNDIWFFMTGPYSPEQLYLPKGEYSLQNFGCKYSVPCAFHVIANGI